ncbi:MAG: AAA family ATPase [Bacteroidales bacterium]|nr:AAA family ATPase [Bacteroidales bacterium]
MIVGRVAELQELRGLLSSEESQFVAVYGRRRVGKTFLIREAFDYKFTFQHTGIYNAKLREQLSAFRESLYSAGMKKSAMPKSWTEAFRLLSRFIEDNQSDEKKIIFIDEMPWMDTPRSNFVSALDHFWNGWSTTRKDIVLIICGSATSWIIENVIMNYGGLHNRLTNQIPVAPFTLNECREYCEAKGLGYTDRQILEAYMAIGGIPYYWSFMEKGKSVAQNFDKLFFSQHGKLTHEFDALYASLFKKPKAHIATITALAMKKMGLTRDEILKSAKMCDNDDFSNALRELEQCGFIRKFTVMGKKTKGTIYQLMDNYTLFYFDFIRENVNGDENFWTSHLETTLHYGWAGRAFERVCLQHLPQIKQGLGISAVITNSHAWRVDDAQIDLLIDRNDETINLCEMKYSSSEYHLSDDEMSKLQNRKSALIRETGTKKSVLLTMITTYGLASGGHSNDIHCQLTMESLFS